MMNWKELLYKFLKSKKNLLGNYDNPFPPDWYLPEKPFLYRLVRWGLRNPLHNFMFFWIGFKDRNLDYTQIWNERQNWNLVLPFFSYRGKKWEWYIGWRPDSRAFGIALRRRK